MWILLCWDLHSLITYRVLLPFGWEREMNEFGVIRSSCGVYLQRKHTKSRVYAKSCFPCHTVHKEESPMCSEITWSLPQALYPTFPPPPLPVGLGFLPGLHMQRSPHGWCIFTLLLSSFHISLRNETKSPASAFSTWPQTLVWYVPFLAELNHV